MLPLYDLALDPGSSEIGCVLAVFEMWKSGQGNHQAELCQRL